MHVAMGFHEWARTDIMAHMTSIKQKLCLEPSKLTCRDFYMPSTEDPLSPSEGKVTQERPVKGERCENIDFLIKNYHCLLPLVYMQGWIQPALSCKEPNVSVHTGRRSGT